MHVTLMMFDDKKVRRVMSDNKVSDEQHLMDRISELEVKAAYQEDTIEQLNQALAQQQRVMSDLEYKLQLISDKLKAMPVTDIVSAQDEPPPPHY